MYALSNIHRLGLVISYALINTFLHTSTFQPTYSTQTKTRLFAVLPVYLERLAPQV